MARPIRNNADYFSHDADMRNDPKIKAMRNKFGLTGYAVYCMTLEVLTNSDFFKREIDEIEIEILSADFGIDADSFTDIIAYMLRLKLLQTEDNCTYLSQKLTDRLQAVTDKRQKARDRAISVTESTQSKVNKRKVKKSKVNIDLYTNWDKDRLWSEISKSNDNKISKDEKGYSQPYLQWFYLDLIAPTKKGNLKFQERESLSVGGLLSNYATQGYYKGGSPYAE
jgi:hypothetical protein